MSPILSGLYIASLLHMIYFLHKFIVVEDDDGNSINIEEDFTSTNIKQNGHLTVQFFVNDRLLHIEVKIDKNRSENPRYDQLLINMMVIKKVYQKMINAFIKIELEIETDKLELMHFIKKHKHSKG